MLIRACSDIPWTVFRGSDLVGVEQVSILSRFCSSRHVLLIGCHSSEVSPSSSASKASERSGFHVPNDDIESVADASDVESCLIVKSNPRTFSVPSSGDEAEETDDDDDVIISTSRRTLLTKRKSTPETRQTSTHLGGLYKEPNGQGQRTEGQSQLGSQKDSISFREDSTISDDLFDDSSADEESDSSPEGHGQKKIPIERDTTSTPESITEIPDTYQSSPSYPTEAHNKRVKNDGNDQVGDGSYAMTFASNAIELGPDTQHCSRSSPTYKPRSPQISGSPLPDIQPDQDHTSEDDSEEDEDSATSQAVIKESPVFCLTSKNTQAYSMAPPISTAKGSAADFSGLSAHTSMQEAVQNSPYFEWSRTSDSEFGCSQSQGTTYNPYYPPSARWNHPSTTARARAPSPSDAALVRKATRELADSDNPFLPATQDGEPSVSGRHNDTHAHLDPFTGSNHYIPPSGYVGHTRMYPSSTVYRSTVASIPSHLTDDWQPSRKRNLDAERSVDYQQGPFSRDPESFHSAAYSPHTDAQPTSPFPQKRRLVRLKIDHNSARQDSNGSGNEGSVCSPQLKLDSAKPSKVDISNLVNSHMEKSRSLKRKSDLISAGEQLSSAVEAASQPSSKQFANPHQTESRTPLSDPSTTVAASLPEQTAHELPQLTASAAVEEPARKKIKTSTAKASNIGGLLSGLCLGVAGALAAFLAAIPADVRDEALRETVNLL